jgi:hypothetical protein
MADALKRGDLPIDSADISLKASMVARKTRAMDGHGFSRKDLHWDYWQGLGGGLDCLL